MIKNYFKVAFRNIWKNKILSSINIIGLAVGICCMLLAILYWKDERSYDQFHKKNPDLYRITANTVENAGDKPHITDGTGQVQGPAFKAQVPEILEYTRLLGGGIFSDYRANERLLKLNLLYADDSFFDVFSFKLIHGDPKTALKELNSVVITEATALKFFNSTNVIGRQFNMEADPSAQRLGKPLVITGVVQNLPKHSSIQFEILHPFRFLQLSFDDKNWLNSYLGTFVVLYPAADIEKVIEKFNHIYSKNAPAQIKETGHDPKIGYGLQPITDIHLHSYTADGSSSEGGVLNGSKPAYSYLFLGIAFFILLMASINFVNISIANSMRRVKEVGIRKITGSSKFQIILQFVGESAILCIISFVLALVLAQTILPVFNKLTDKQIAWQDFDMTLSIWFFLLLISNIVLTGFYPAYILSNFKAAETLYNRQKISSKNIFGQSLIVIQFSLSVFLIVTSIVFYSQMKFIKTKDLGYKPNQVIRTNIAGNREYKPIQNFLKNEIAKEPSIFQISFGGPMGDLNTYIQNRTVKSTYRRIDENYISTLGIQLKEGRNLSYGTKSEALVNEAFVKQAGLLNPVGISLQLDSQYYDSKRVVDIVGVVKDFHFGSLKERIQPMVMYQEPENSGSIFLKIDQSQQQKALQAFETIYKKAIPDAIYEYNFLDELNAREYKQEQRWEKIISIATALSLIICCLGLFGLSRLATHQRTKEIGIRKVLGASVMQITSLLSKEFMGLIILAFLIATPAGWWATHEWLQNFEYRVQIGWWIFGLAGLIALGIALFTISFQAVKAAIANPVKSLRTE
ncbi:MAG: FtsX-like permease family protein [Ginsengibacter sp.]